MMAIKAVTPSLFLVFVWVVFHGDAVIRNLVDVVKNIIVISDNFLLQDFFDMFSCIVSELKLLFNSILFW